MHIPARSGGPDGVETIVRVFAETVGRVVSDVDAHRVAAVVRVTDRAVLGERVFHPVNECHVMFRFGRVG